MRVLAIIARTEIGRELSPPKQSHNVKRYHSDPVYAETTKKKAIAWNQQNPERKRKNDKKWAKKNAAAAVRRYRLRKKGISA